MMNLLSTLCRKTSAIQSLVFYYFISFVFVNASQAAENNVNNSDQAMQTAQVIEVIEVTNSHTFSSINYQVLRRADFIDSAQTLADVLQSINGIQIRKISGIGNPVSISIRGSSAKQVQMYIDGQLVNDSQFGGFDLNQIPTEQIESIEVSKNQALGTGSTPIGGVIRINTYNPSENKKKISLSAGSFGYKEISLLSNSAFKTHSLAIGGSYVTSDNNYEYLVPQDFNNPSQSIKQPLRNNEFDKLSLFLNDNAQFGKHQLRFNLQYNKQDKALANYQNNSPENTSYIETKRVRYGFQDYWQSSALFFDSIELEGVELDYYGENKSEFYLDSPNQTRQNTSDYQSNNQHIGIKPNLTWQTINLAPFININKQTFRSESKKNGTASLCNGISRCDIKAKQSQINFGTRIEWQSDNTPFSSYILASWLKEKNENTTLNTTNNNDPKHKLKQNNNYSTQEFGINYANKNFRNSISISKGIRTPTLLELFGDRGSFKGNSNLLPEQANTITLGSQYKGKNFTVSSSLYHQDLDNSIVAIFNSSGVGSYTNVASAVLNGFEFQGDLSLTLDLSLSIQINFIDSQTNSEFIAFDDKKLPGIYHQQYSAALLYKLTPDWHLKINNSIDKDLYFNRSNQFQSTHNKVGGGNPANRNLTELSLNWRSQKYHATLSINNLFNDEYQELANRPAQGRSIQLKFSIEEL